MPNENPPRDRFDVVPRRRGRIGAHRAEHPHGRAIVVVLWVVLALVVFGAAGVVGFLALLHNSPLAGAELVPGDVLIAAGSYTTIAVGG